MQSISPPLGRTAGGTNVVGSRQGEWPEGAVVLIDGVVHAGTLDVSSPGRVSFTTPAGLTEESVTLSSDLCGGALLFETYGKQAATHKQNSQQMLLNDLLVVCVCVVAWVWFYVRRLRNCNGHAKHNHDSRIRRKDRK